MTQLAFTFAILGACFAAMALGPLLGRRPLRRGCGDAVGGDCRACARPCPHRPPLRGDGGPDR